MGCRLGWLRQYAAGPPRAAGRPTWSFLSPPGARSSLVPASASLYRESLNQTHRSTLALNIERRLCITLQYSVNCVFIVSVHWTDYSSHFFFVILPLGSHGDSKVSYQAVILCFSVSKEGDLSVKYPVELMCCAVRRSSLVPEPFRNTCRQRR